MAWQPDYTTSSDMRAFLRIDDGWDDAQLALAITAASRSIDHSCRRQFGKADAPEARAYTAFYDPTRDRWVVPVDDLMDMTGLVVKFDTDSDETYTSTITSYGLRPANAAQRGRPWEDLVIHPNSAVLPDDREAGVQVTALWGWAAVPDAVKEACLLQASRLMARRDSPFGTSGTAEARTELRLLAKVDPDVEVSLADYKRGTCPAVFA